MTDDNESRGGLAVLFSEQGRREEPTAWRYIDRLEDFCPTEVERIHQSSTDYECDPILLRMQEAIAVNPNLDDDEREQLTKFVIGLRHVVYTPLGRTQGETERLLRQASEMLRQR